MIAFLAKTCFVGKVCILVGAVERNPLFTFPYLGMNFQKLNLMKNMDNPTFFDWKSYFGLKEDILKCFCSQRGLKMAKKEMFSPWLPVNYEEHSYQN